MERSRVLFYSFFLNLISSNRHWVYEKENYYCSTSRSHHLYNLLSLSPPSLFIPIYFVTAREFDIFSFPFEKFSEDTSNKMSIIHFSHHWHVSHANRNCADPRNFTYTTIILRPKSASLAKTKTKQKKKDKNLDDLHNLIFFTQANIYIMYYNK